MATVITGGICTGKSTVCKIFEKNGYKIVDADKIAHGLLDENSVYIEKLFGKKYIKEKKVDRKRLGRLIFSNEKKRKALENLLHPKIREEIKKKSQKLESKYKKYIIDVPLFFESNAYKADSIIVVYASKKTQIKRLMKRDNLTKYMANKRVKLQMDIERKRELADFVIDNSKDLKYLKEKVEKLIKLIGENSANIKI